MLQRRSERSHTLGRYLVTYLFIWLSGVCCVSEGVSLFFWSNIAGTEGEPPMSIRFHHDYVEEPVQCRGRETGAFDEGDNLILSRCGLQSSSSGLCLCCLPFFYCRISSVASSCRQ